MHFRINLSCCRACTLHSAPHDAYRGQTSSRKHNEDIKLTNKHQNHCTAPERQTKSPDNNCEGYVFGIEGFLRSVQEAMKMDAAQHKANEQHGLNVLYVNMHGMRLIFDAPEEIRVCLSSSECVCEQLKV